LPQPNIPPRHIPVLIKELDGRILAREVASIYENGSVVKLEKVSLLEVVGVKHGLEPIYRFKKNPIRFAYIKTEDIVHWENLPSYLKLKD
jgi:hypothetical protein